ncbi:MAG TPA: PA2169 family four-helix-bundle protein, partial [Cyclobacteriaceae bacterium]|nr:PA2169 family four-helix-bundle protein [Cyclobacteriaceae bacterium]
WYNFFSGRDSNVRSMKTRQRDKTIEVLNDLIKINTDRADGYTLALRESKDADLKIMFRNMVTESKKNITDLSRIILNLDGDPKFGENTVAGKIYHVWMELKTSFTGKDRQSILNACEFGEDAAAKAYKGAIQEQDLITEAFDVIYRQAQLQRASHDVIKAYREASLKLRQAQYENTTFLK